MHTALFVLTTIAGMMAFALGVMQLIRLRRLIGREAENRSDPFENVIGFLFARFEENPAITRQQKYTIWMFCLAMLLLFVGRMLAASSG